MSMTPHEALRQQAAGAVRAAWDADSLAYWPPIADSAADAVLRVVLDAATASIEALPGHPVVLEEHAGPVQYDMVRTDRVLAALDALKGGTRG